MRSQRIQVCPKKWITPTAILFFSDGIGTQNILFDQEGSGFLGDYHFDFPVLYKTFCHSVLVRTIPTLLRPFARHFVEKMAISCSFAHHETAQPSAQPSRVWAAPSSHRYLPCFWLGSFNYTLGVTPCPANEKWTFEKGARLICTRWAPTIVVVNGVMGPLEMAL